MTPNSKHRSKLAASRVVKSLRRTRAGMTLIELAVGIGVSLLVASAVLGLLNNQMYFARYVQQQNFMLIEAPQINNILSRMLFSADTARLYTDINSGKGGGAGVTANAAALVLAFHQPDGTFNYGMIGFDPGTNRLGYYRRGDSGWPDQPSWIITGSAESVTFRVENGVVRCTITGPNQEELTFSGAGQN